MLVRKKLIPAGRYGGPAIHPGRILHDDFMEPLGLTAYALAMALCVSQTRLGEILAGKRAITADTALRLAKYFDTSPALWMNLQAAYDLRLVEIDHGAKIEADVAGRV